MAQLGRIGGGVLAPNLERQGVNLSFKNQANSTPVLFFDVENSQIGFNTDILIPGRDFSIPNKMKSVGLKSEYIDVPNYVLQNNRIEVESGNILLDAGTKIQVSGLTTDDLRIQNNTIFSNSINTNIELRPTKNVAIYSDFLVNGNLFSTGNIVLQSDFIFGNEEEDTVIFDATIESDLIPKINNTSSIGSNDSRWRDFYVDFFNGSAFNTSEISIGDFNNVVLPQGNILYVASTGNDLNRGEHQQNPLRTIRRALEIVEASSLAPTTIYVFPGVYNEITPLIVPENVTIKGTDIRNTIIIPDSVSDSEDVFLLNDRTTIESLTIKNFFYNSADNTGYAFRFAPGAVLATRSPYIKNVSVITNGSNITSEDPRGFLSGDAGAGAYFDRAELDSSSSEASVLFHAVTFITPGVDAVTLTNNVKMECINLFTYFANRGLYAINGAEVRSINSINAYGNFGVVADGSNSLFYLIGHNFAYVGTGQRTDNDTTLKIEDNEAVRFNNGKIFYNSIDELGKFKVGDIFFVDQETGETNLISDDTFFDNLSSITITNLLSTTFIDFSKIDVGNFSFAGNTIFSLTGDINVFSSSDEINFTRNQSSNIANVIISKNLQLNNNLTTNDVVFNGEVEFNAYVNSNIIPTNNLTNNLGSINNNWRTIYLTENKVNQITIDNNKISINELNEDLLLTATGIGLIKLEDILFKNNFLETTLATIEFNTDNVIVSSDKAIKINSGSTIERDFTEFGIRLNTDDFVFEGFTNNAVIGFGGIYSDDRRTKLTVDKYNNSISFIANNVSIGNINADRLFSTKISIDQISIDTNQFFINNGTSNLLLTPNGSGVILINEVEYFSNSSILNKVQDSAFTLANTGDGYTKFAGTFGLAVPNSDETSKVNSPELGETIYNTDIELIEIWNGTEWIPSTGIAATIEANEFEDITNEWTLILG